MATKPVSVMYSFYRPHARVQEDGRMVNAATGEITYPPSRTKQEFQAECDINNILKQFSTTGMLRHVNAKAAQGAYQDLPDAVDLQQSLEAVHRAQESFLTLPSKLRARFENDPVQFLGFLQDPANRDEAKQLGLLELPPPPAAPIAVSIVNTSDQVAPGSDSSQAQGRRPSGPKDKPSGQEA